MKNVNITAIELIKESKEIIDSAKRLKEEGFSFRRLKNLTVEVASVVEKYTKEIGELSSDTKIALGVDILTNLVDIPYVPQWIEKKIYVIGIKKIIKYLNKYIGKDWLQSMEEEIKENAKMKTTKVKKKAKKKVKKIVKKPVDKKSSTRRKRSR